MTSPTQLEVWLQGFPREDAERRVRELERELTSLRDALALHDSFTSSQNGHATPHDDSDADPANRPDAIRRILRNSGGQPMTPAALKNGLIDRGWLDGTE